MAPCQTFYRKVLPRVLARFDLAPTRVQLADIRVELAKTRVELTATPTRKVTLTQLLFLHFFAICSGKPSGTECGSGGLENRVELAESRVELAKIGVESADIGENPR